MLNKCPKCGAFGMPVPEDKIPQWLVMILFLICLGLAFVGGWRECKIWNQPVVQIEDGP